MILARFARRGRLHRLSRDRAGNAAIEFALGFPVAMAFGAFGLELSNLVLTRLQVGQIAVSLADNASRIGVNNGQATYQLREGDINDILQGARLMGTSLQLTTRGRVTISSLENVAQTFSDHANDTAPVQRLHWQRCVGLRGGSNDPGFDSSYGPATPVTTAGTDSTYANRGPNSGGIGSPVINAPSGAGVIYVEVNYLYTPLFGSMFAKSQIVHAVGTFVVRDRRDFAQIYNPKTALGTTPAASTCNLFAA